MTQSGGTVEMETTIATVVALKTVIVTAIAAMVVGTVHDIETEEEVTGVMTTFSKTMSVPATTMSMTPITDTEVMMVVTMVAMMVAMIELPSLFHRNDAVSGISAVFLAFFVWRDPDMLTAFV
jgi:hypothetical protein